MMMRQVHALSPTGLSVALVLGSQLLGGDASPDKDLNLDEAFSSTRRARRPLLDDAAAPRAAPPAAPSVAAAADDEAAEEEEEAQEEDDPLPRRLAGLQSSKPDRSTPFPAASGAARGRTPTTAASLRTPAGSGPVPLSGRAAYPTLEEFAQREKSGRRG